MSLMLSLWGKLMSSRLESDFLNTSHKAIIKFEIMLEKYTVLLSLPAWGEERKAFSTEIHSHPLS